MTEWFKVKNQKNQNIMIIIRKKTYFVCMNIPMDLSATVNLNLRWDIINILKTRTLMFIFANPAKCFYISQKMRKTTPLVNIKSRSRRLQSFCKVLRDGLWSEQEAAILVLGYIISIKLCDIVPADARLLDGDPLKIDQSALTGDYLPVTKNPSDEVFSGLTCKQGEIEAVVIATGVHTFFEKAAPLVDNTNNVGHFQKALIVIENCSIAVGTLNLLVFLIGRIPIATPTVLCVTMTIGSHRLSEQGAITKRMTAIEEMAGMDDIVHSVKFAEQGFRSLAVARHEVPEKTKESARGPWQFVGLLPLFDRPRHDVAEIIRRALNLRVNVKMITGDQLGIAKERKHICGMTGDAVNDAPALKKADIGIAVVDATDAAQGASYIVITQPGLSVIISAVLTSQVFLQRTKNYTDSFKVRPISGNNHEMAAALYLQVSTISKAFIFVTRSCGISFMERPGMFLMGAFLIAKLVATLLAVYHNWEFARIWGVGWGWAGVIWLYSLITFFPLDILKFIIPYVLSGKAWDNVLDKKTAFITKKDYGKEEREAQWALAQRTVYGLQPAEINNLFPEKSSYRELSEIAEQAKRQAKPRLQGFENFTHSRDMLSPW